MYLSGDDNDSHSENGAPVQSDGDPVIQDRGKNGHARAKSGKPGQEERSPPNTMNRGDDNHATAEDGGPIASEEEPPPTQRSSGGNETGVPTSKNRQQARTHRQTARRGDDETSRPAEPGRPAGPRENSPSKHRRGGEKQLNVSSGGTSYPEHETRHQEPAEPERTAAKPRAKKHEQVPPPLSPPSPQPY